MPLSTADPLQSRPGRHTREDVKTLLRSDVGLTRDADR